MNEINLLINAIKSEAQTQAQELEEIKQTIFTLLENIEITKQDKKETSLFGVTFNYRNDGWKGKRICFDYCVTKRIYHSEKLKEYTSAKYTLEDLQTFSDEQIAEDSIKYRAEIEKAIEELYRFDLVPYFMQYLSAKILPQFLRKDFKFTDFHF